MMSRRRSAYTYAKRGWKLSGIDWITPAVVLFLIVKVLSLFKR